jgi:hypothetical protein
MIINKEISNELSGECEFNWNWIKEDNVRLTFQALEGYKIFLLCSLFTFP